MTTVAQLTIEMAANVARLSTDMDAARRKVDSTFGAIGKDVQKLKSLLGGVFAGFGAAQTLGKLVDVQRQFDVLNSSLVTVTGSSMAAQAEFQWIKRFAATTPYQLADVTSAFVKMKALGLDASERALASYGNTASAMGKGLNQMIEAVADAATGEFERLKEFGIKSRKNGEDVSFTFQGVTTTVKNSASEITGYLNALGENQFAGAMAQRAATLDGAISNLADTWDELFRTVSQGNAGSLIYSSVKLANGVLTDAVTIMQALNSAIRDGARDTGAFTSAQSAIATVFETVAVLGANVKFVLVSVGRELGGIAAQSVQILQGNFAGAAAIRQQLLADAEAGRREVDETTSRILNARRLAAIAAVGAGMDEPRFSRLLNPSAGAASRTSAAASAAASKAAKAAEAAELRRIIDLAQYRNQLFDEEFEKEERARLVVEGRIRSGRELLQAIERETYLMGLSKEQREQAVASFDLERAGVVQGTEAYTRFADAIRQAVAARQSQEQAIAEKKAADDARKKEEEDNARRSRDLANSIEEGILTGFRNGQTLADIFISELKAQFGKTVLQPVIKPIADAGSQILGSLLGSILPSFDGGGFTGYGARSGGLDGQGGYLAMLHPRETVVDHTKGQGAQAPVTVIQNFTVGDVASISMVRAAVAGSEARIAGAMQRSMKYGGPLS